MSPTSLEKNNIENIEDVPLQNFSEKAYLDYSMYVILDRALPFIGDGLKPVQRRIIYAMSELGIRSTSKYKKSARTVGDVLGKFHPHGDTACYEAMVLMAQPFSFRYPLIDGQGNWGGIDDPKSFAAMRYTEAKLSAYADALLTELGQQTVDWVPNFDGTLKEPKVLPARLPNIILNGTTGIAVGMATDIPPHNLPEVIQACTFLIDNPEATLSDILNLIKGPDYPTGAEIITPPAEIYNIYEKGVGGIRMRATFQFENGDIIITSLPHQTSSTKILEQIALQMQTKKLPMVSDIRDESDHEEPTRIVIVPRSNRIDKDALMDHLFATTDLERNMRVNLNVIGLNGKPQVKPLLSLLNEWLIFRIQTVRRRLEFDLKKIVERLHILEGYRIAYLNIDEIIYIIRNEDHPKPILMKKFLLSDIQAEAILDLKLRRLAKLEEEKILAEIDKLNNERKDIEKILGSDYLLKELIKTELKKDCDQYGNERRSPIIERKEAHALSHADLSPIEPVSIILSEKGWVRAAKGHEIDENKLNFKSGDQLKTIFHGRSNQTVVFIDSTGRSYSLMAHTLPSARGQGEPLTGRLNPPPGASFEALLTGKPDRLILMASDAGYGFITRLSELYTKNRAGKVVINLPEGSNPLPPIVFQNLTVDIIICISNEGRMLAFPVKSLPAIARGKGNKIMHISPNQVKNRSDFIMHLLVVPPETHLNIVSGKRFMAITPESLSSYYGERGRRGKKLPRGFRKVDSVEVKKTQQKTLF